VQAAADVVWSENRICLNPTRLWSATACSGDNERMNAGNP
jgi:hypothetical protein